MLGKPPSTVGDVIALFLANPGRDVSQRAHADRRHVLERFALAHPGLSLSDARPYHLRLWVDAQQQLKSDWTVRRWISAVKCCFGWAYRLGIIDRQPFAGLVHRPGKRGRPLTDDEFRGMMRAATDGRMRRLLLFLRVTGCRPGEASAAKWSDIDLPRGCIVLDKHKTEHATGRPRTIYLPAVALRLLAWMRRHEVRQVERNGVVWKRVHDCIFTNAWAAPWQRSTLSQRLAGMRDRAGLPRDAKLYGLRHKLATDAILHGVDIATLAELLGHSGTRTTSYYVHLAGQTGHLRDAIERALR